MPFLDFFLQHRFVYRFPTNIFLFQWGVLVCGHCFCLDCLQILIQRSTRVNNKAHFKCAVCRASISTDEVSYVSTEKKKTWHDQFEGTKFLPTIKVTLFYSKKKKEKKIKSRMVTELFLLVFLLKESSFLCDNKKKN